VQLVRGAFPKGSASGATDAENVHDAIDGRVWFFPELANGWSSAKVPAASSSKPSPQSSPKPSTSQWYAVDFGKPVTVSRAELAFFADGKDFVAPRSLRIQIWDGTRWTPLGAPATPVANGITAVGWTPVSTSKIRVSFPQAPTKRTRLVEFKVF